MNLLTLVTLYWQRLRDRFSKPAPAKKKQPPRRRATVLLPGDYEDVIMRVGRKKKK